MKSIASFLFAVVGGLVVAGVFFFGPGSRPSDSRGDEMTRLRGELGELRDRVAKLEASARLVARRPIAAEKDAALKEEFLEAARTAARDVATTVAAPQTSELDRGTALSRALEQVRAPHEDTRRNGIRRLRRMFAAEASAQVVPALSDESSLVRMEAATYFEYLWDPAALEPLVELMYGDNVSVAEQALDALCKSGEEEAIAELRDYYLEGPVLELAYEAGKALEENNRASAVPDGVERFRDALSSTDPAERRIGIAGVARWGHASTDAWRVRALAEDADSRVRTQVERTLAAWGLESDQ